MDLTIKNLIGSAAFSKAVIVLIGIVVLFFINRIIQKNLGRYVTEKQTRYKVKKIIRLIILAIAILFLSIVFKERLGGLALALGVAGAGIAFALQEVIVSIAGWISISVGNFYRTGDRVQLGDIKGDIIDIGMLQTTLMECGEWIKADQYTGRIIRIANSIVFKEPVYNYSADFPFLWDEVTIPVRLDSDHTRARQIVHDVVLDTTGEYAQYAKNSWLEAAKKYLIDEGMFEPGVTSTFNDNWAEFTARYVVDYKKRRSTKDKIFSEILQRFADTGGEVQIGSTSLELSNKVFDVNVSK